MTTTQAINKVCKHLKQLGIEVNLNSNTYCFDRDESTIYCAYNSDAIITLCSLLHEAGHALQSSSTFELLRSSLYRDKAIIAEQEYTAWKEGWALAQQLNLNCSHIELTYKKIWMKCWMQYITNLSHSDRQYTKDLVYSYIESRV